MSKLLFGQIFISYSSIDKTIARKVSSRLKKEGYSVWLDEKDLKLGDELAKEVGSALAQAKVVIILVSENSVRSAWFGYEINIATERMIKEKIRLIPLLIDGVKPPENLKGILYGDLKNQPKKTWSQLVKVINSEYENFYITSKLNILSKHTTSVFGPIGYGFPLSENPFSKGGDDYELITINFDEKDYEVIYTELRAYSEDKMLSYYDWSKYQDILQEWGWNARQDGQYSLLVTNYKLSEDLNGKMKQVAMRSYALHEGTNLYLMADLSENPSNQEAIKVLQSLKTYFEKFIKNSLSLLT